MRKILILLGPPGVGKGTVGGVLSKKWNVPIISSGDILRKNVKRETSYGKNAKEYMHKGELVPDNIVVKIIKERIDAEDCKEGFIMDGFPRNIYQAKVFEEIIKNKNICRVVYLKTSDGFLIKRLADRRICEKCAAIYHLVNLPPQSEGTCDKCSGKLIQRKDDTIEVIQKRLKVYHELTSPLLDYYIRKGILEEISGENNLEETIQKIIQALEW